MKNISSDNTATEGYDIPENEFGDDGILSNVYDLRWEQISDQGPAGEAASTGEDKGYPLEPHHYDSLETALDPVPDVIGSRNARGEERDNMVLGLYSYDTGAVSGFKPSGPAHFGHYQTARTLHDLQETGIEVYVPVADVEALNDGYDQEHIDRTAADNLIDWGAAGLNLDQAHVYLQSEEERLEDGKEQMGDHLTLKDAMDAYGMDKISENPLFIPVGLNQVSDLVLPQHESFGKNHSFMVSGSDQAGHMQMTRNLIEAAVSEDDTYIESVPGGLYCPEIKGLQVLDDTSKASSSVPDTSIYIGPAGSQLDLDARIEDGLAKIDSAEDAGSDQLERSTRDHLWVLGEDYTEDPIEKLRDVLPEFLENHQERRQAVAEYAQERAQGKDPSQPEFWPENPDAQVPEDERNETEWHNIVDAMDGEVVL